MTTTQWHMKEGTPEWTEYMSRHNPELLERYKLKKRILDKADIEVDENPLMDMTNRGEHSTSGRDTTIQEEIKEGYFRKIRQGAHIENVRIAKDVPSWLILLHLFPKEPHPELYKAVRKALSLFYKGWVLPEHIPYQMGDRDMRTIHISGVDGICAKGIDWWTERLGDAETLSGGRVLSNKFYRMMDRMRRRLERRIYGM